MKGRRRAIYSDEMHRQEQPFVEWTPDEEERLKASGRDLRKAGLLLAWGRALDEAVHPMPSDEDVNRLHAECEAMLCGDRVLADEAPFGAKWFAERVRGQCLRFLHSGGKDRRRAADQLQQTLETAYARHAHMPAIKKATKRRDDGRRGHEATHGTDRDKAARWARMAKAYEAARTAGAPKMAARSIVAERFGVSDQTVMRAVKRCGK